MQFLRLLAGLAAQATLAFAASGCDLHGSLVKDLDFEFNIAVTTRDGAQALPLTVAQLPDEGGFFFPLTLGERNASADSQVQFQLAGAAAYSDGGLVLSTKTTTLLFPAGLYDAADDRDIPAGVGAVPATCNGKETHVLRFLDVLNLPTGRGSVQKSFAPGSGIQTPLLLGLLDLVPIDLVVVPIPGSSAGSRKRAARQSRQFKQL